MPIVSLRSGGRAYAIVTLLVLDTNIVLDLWWFEDTRVQPLLAALQAGQVRWLATMNMREELARVLTYPHLTRRPRRREQDPLAEFDRYAELVPPAVRAPYVCKDPDDQQFIDLAAAHSATLLSKDAQVLTMARRLQRLGVLVLCAWEPANPALQAVV
jgi:putative PIN family toxin of toxin-antitoxin system